MKTIVHDTYGAPEVLHFEDVALPTPDADQILVEVHAFPVTTADWRFRSSTFPPAMWLVGRLMTGLLRPRVRLTGREFAGKVLAVGTNVTRFAVGDRVLGIHAGVSAERIAVAKDAPMVKIPSTLGYAEAAALPFGAQAALDFADRVAQVQPGERVLIVGASGGVGSYLVQIAKHLGAHVTAVASTRNLEFLRELGADEVIDYTTTHPAETGQTWDVVFDVVGQAPFASYRRALGDKGRLVVIEGTLREMLQSLTTRLFGGPRVLFDISSDSTEGLTRVLQLVARGGVRPVIGHRFAFEDTIDAHRLVDGRRRRGAVVVEVIEPAMDLAAAQ